MQGFGGVFAFVVLIFPAAGTERKTAFGSLSPRPSSKAGESTALFGRTPFQPPWIAKATGGAAAQAMSNVRISNGSPTLERMEARQADYPKPSACRNLFGPVDREELARELQKHRRDLDEDNRRKWNFDFHNHQPLDGRYEWQAVGKDALPDFYSRPPRLSRAKQQQHLGGLDVNGNCPTGGFGRSRGIEQEEEERTASPKTEASGAPADFAAQTAGPRKRPASDDSSPRNKRANTTEAISEDSPSASSVEQTPKKSSPRQDQT